MHPVTRRAAAASGNIRDFVRPPGTSRSDRAMRIQAIQEKASDFAKDLKDGLTTPGNIGGDGLATELLQTDKLGARGEIYVALQFVFIALVIVSPVDLRPVSQIVGIVAVLMGLAIIVAGSNALGKNLTPLPVPRDSATLTTDGMYKWMRHPLYTGLILAAGGVAAASQDSSRALFALGLTVVLMMKAEFEEKQLIAEFGEKYEQYMNDTKRFWFF